MKKYKYFIIPLVTLILFISGCSKDRNKADIDEKMFDEGKQVVKLYSKVYNGEDDKKVTVATDKYLIKYQASNTLSFHEKLFVGYIRCLELSYQVYASDKAIGDKPKIRQDREEMKKILLKFKDTFGISLEE